MGCRQPESVSGASRGCGGIDYKHMSIQWDKAFESIVSISADAIISIDEEQRIIQFNKGAEEIFGWSAEETVGQHIELLIPDRFRPGHADHVRKFGESPIQARRMGERREIAGLRRNGEEFPAEASISKIESGGQRIYTVVLRDVTERKRREQELERAIAARDDVLSFVSHDLGNPLAAIRIATAVLLRDNPNAKHVLGIREAVEHAQRLIRDLLDVQKMEAGKLPLDLERVDLDSLIDESIRSLQPFIEEKQINVMREVESHLPRVYADRARIAQVFANLIGNAVKFSPARGTVGVRAFHERGEIVAVVTDQGPGIAPDHLPHLFDRYWQAHAGKVGHGIGLSIVHAIVRVHGGRLWAESELAKGSAFYFALPALED